MYGKGKYYIKNRFIKNEGLFFYGCHSDILNKIQHFQLVLLEALI